MVGCLQDRGDIQGAFDEIECAFYVELLSHIKDR